MYTSGTPPREIVPSRVFGESDAGKYRRGAEASCRTLDRPLVAFAGVWFPTLRCPPYVLGQCVLLFRNILTRVGLDASGWTRRDFVHSDGLTYSVLSLMPFRDRVSTESPQVALGIKRVGLNR